MCGGAGLHWQHIGWRDICARVCVCGHIRIHLVIAVDVDGGARVWLHHFAEGCCCARRAGAIGAGCERRPVELARGAVVFVRCLPVHGVFVRCLPIHGVVAVTVAVAGAAVGAR